MRIKSLSASYGVNLGNGNFDDVLKLLRHIFNRFHFSDHQIHLDMSTVIIVSAIETIRLVNAKSGACYCILFYKDLF